MIKNSQVGVSPDEIIGILKNLLKETDTNLKYDAIEKLRSRVQSPEHSSRLGGILGALKIPDSMGNGAVRDPSSGEVYPVTNTLIEDYIKELEGLKKMSSTFNLSKFSQKVVKKKKSRGNPFRVLMGKVGKLLDHGLQKREIVRYLTKERTWNADTVEKAVGVVKDYSKKKHKKEKKEVTAQTLRDTADIWPRLELDYTKRSTVELITSITWLNSLDKVNPNQADTKEVADRAGIKNMIRKIKAELLNRGMSEENLDSIL